MAKLTADQTVAGAKDFFEESQNHEADWREAWHDDLEFHALDQWPAEARLARAAQANEPARPIMTIDQTDQYVRQIVNDARLSPPALKANPVDDKADIRTAEDLQGLFRHIERVSRAPKAYLNALEWAVVTGRGWFRVHSQLVNEERNHYEPRIGRIANCLSCYGDPYSTEIDGSDQTDAMLIVDHSHAAFKRKWPKASTVGSWDTNDHWYTADNVRVAEWHSVRERDKTMVLTAEGEMTQEQAKEAGETKGLINFRETVRQEKVCTIRQMTGFEVLEETEFHAGHVGLIPVYGNERYTRDGRKLFGMIRAAKDAQRLTNFLASNLAEAANSQTKAQWLAAAESIKNFETMWAKANTSSQAYLLYNHLDAMGMPLPPPNRSSVDLNLAGYANLIQMGHQMLQTTIGMYQASVGAQSNETSGVAIARRKSESDVGTYHYIDNLSDSMQHAGRIIMAMLPKVYDTARVARILGEDGEPSQVRIDPGAEESFSEQTQPDGKKMHVLNPGIGEYDVYVTVGPSYASQREETASTLTELYGRNPDLMTVSGDVYFDNLNFPGSKAIAKRLKTMLPDPIKAMEDESEMPAEIAQQISRAQQAFEQREQMIQMASAEADKVIEASKEARAQAQVATAQIQTARAQMDTARAHLENERADLEHQRQLLANAQAQAQRDMTRMTNDLTQAFQPPEAEAVAP